MSKRMELIESQMNPTTRVDGSGVRSLHNIAGKAQNLGEDGMEGGNMTVGSINQLSTASRASKRVIDFDEMYDDIVQLKGHLNRLICQQARMERDIERLKLGEQVD